MLNKSFKLNDMRVRDANRALEDSMDTRQKVKHKLSMCSGKGDLAPLERKTEDLNTTDLNRKVRNRHMTCSEARNSPSAQPLISLRTTRPKPRYCFPHRQKLKIHFKRRNRNKPHTPTLAFRWNRHYTMHPLEFCLSLCQGFTLKISPQHEQSSLNKLILLFFAGLP